MSKYCSAPGCTGEAIIRVQPFKKVHWDYFCHVHWLTLAMAVVQDADRAGILDKLAPPEPEVLDDAAVGNDKTINL